MKPSNPRNRRQRRGATTVEVAACLPVLLLVLFAGYEFGRANMLHHASESAAYEGARIGIVPGTSRQKIEDAVRQVLNSVGATDVEITITPSVITNETPNVKVEVAVPMNSNSVLIPFFTRDAVFEGACEMTRETL